MPMDSPIATDCWTLEREIPTDIHMPTDWLLELMASDCWTLYLSAAANKYLSAAANNQTQQSDDLTNQAIIKLTLIIADNN